MTKTLPSINFNSTPGYTDWAFQHEVYSQEFTARSKIACSPGIVDFTDDPAASPYTAERPLMVTVATADPLAVDIAAGYAVTDNHNLIIIDAPLASIPLPDLTADQTYIVAAEYTLIPSAETRVNRFGFSAEARDERPSNTPFGDGSSTLIEAITIATLTDFNNPAVYSTERKADIVVLGVVTSSVDAVGALTITVDATRNTYTFNRPWFSMIDVWHRSKVGTGVISDNNIHGIQLQDLSSAGFTLYQQQISRGGVFAKDFSYFGYPGTFCSELLTINRFEPDYVGTMTNTNGDAVPLAGRYYARLVKLPTRVGSMYFNNEPWNPVPYEWIEGTQIVVLGALENPPKYTKSVVVEYFAVSALAIETEASATQGISTFTVLEPVVGLEWVVSSGIALDTLTQTSLTLSGALAPIKKNYLGLCESNGTLVLSPQQLVPIMRISDLVTSGTLTVSATVHNGLPVTLSVGLTRVPATNKDLNLKLKINGLNAAGGTIEEDVNFRPSQWREPTGDYEEPLQFIKTTKTFAYLNSIRIMNTVSDPHNAGPDAIISVWANILENDKNQEMTSIASFFWDGVKGINVRDRRFIGTTLQRQDQRQLRFPSRTPEQDGAFPQELFSVLLDPPLTDPANQSRRIMTELDEDRWWSETWHTFSTNAASGQILLASASTLTDHLTVRLTPDRHLTFRNIISDPAAGEVAIVTDDTEQRNNIIATINDPVFDSTWFASMGSGSPPPIVLTRTESYPEGFLTSYRRLVAFTGNAPSYFVAGTLEIKLNGIEIVEPGTLTGVVAQATHNATIDHVVQAINAQTPQTGVTATKITTVSPAGFMLTGNADGDAFTLTDWSDVSPGSSWAPIQGGPPDLVASVSIPSDPFSFVQPSGGSLPTPHLPNRYLTDATPWQYVSRPILWEGVTLRAFVALTNNSTASITDGDQIEITTNKRIVAVTDPTEYDPARGHFFADTTPTGLANTLRSMVATINHPQFASGCRASLDETETAVVVEVAGQASAQMALLVESVPNTWILGPGTAQPYYQQVGAGDTVTHGFLKSIDTLEGAEWRFRDLASGWSGWTSMVRLSDTAWKFDGQQGASWYCIQIRLVGQEGKPNGFSLYRTTPQVSGSTLSALDTRLREVEDELYWARGTCDNLNERISTVVSEDGTRVQDPELLAAHVSQMGSDTTSLKSRLDGADALAFWVTGGEANLLTPAAMANFALPNELVSGYTDPVTNNASFMTILPPDQIRIGGTTAAPLVMRVAGMPYTSIDDQTLSLASQNTAGTYYMVANVAPTSMGREIVGGTDSLAAVEGDNVWRTTTNFASYGIATRLAQRLPLLLYLPNVQVDGRPFFSPILSYNPSNPTWLTIAGSLPALPSPGTQYAVVSPRELTFSLEATRLEAANKLYLGEAAWTGTGGSITALASYAYRERFVSRLVLVQVTTPQPAYEAVFRHNLGFMPRNFTIYFYPRVGGQPDLTSGKPLHLGDEAVCAVDSLTLKVRNRYDSLVARAYDGTIQTVGYLQLVI